MTREAFAGLAAALAVLMGLAAPAVAGSRGNLPITTVDVTSYPQVELTVTAPPGLAGADLPDGAFAVTEDGDRRDAETTASATGGLQVAVVLDVSGSMGGPPLADAKAAAADFLTQMPDAAEAAVVSYATTPSLETKLSGDLDRHLAAIAGLRAGGRTATFDAIDTAIDVLGDDGGRRAIVLLTDGEDNESTATLETVAPRLVERDITFHAVEFLTNSGDHEALAAMAAAKGGSVTRADDAEALSETYAAIAAQLSGSYTLRYRSESSGPTAVTVTLDHGGVTASGSQTVTLPQTAGAGADVSQPRVLRVESVDAGDHPTVAVTVVAPRELAGHDLTAEHFGLVEARRARDVTVARVGGQAQEVVVAIDTSGSMRGEAIAAAKEAAADFLAKLPDEAEVAVLAFSGEPVELSGFTADHAEAAATIAGLEAGGYTALYDTVAAAAELFSEEPATTRSVVVLSDGADTASGTALDDAARRLEGTGASLYAVELLTGDTDRAALEALAEPGGGLVVPADDPAALADVYDRLAVDLGNLYVLRYRSDQYGPTELEITVEADGVTARTVETVELPAPPLVQTILGSRWGLVIGATLCYAALALVILLILGPQRRRSTLAGPRGRAAAGEGGTALSALANRASAAAEEGLRRRGRVGDVNAALERAGLPLRPGEFAVLVVCAVVAAAATGLLLSGPLLALGLAVVAGVGGKLALSILAGRRRARFADQLGDTLQLLAGSLRAGYSMLQAVDTVAREADSPTAEEFRRLVLETRLGRDLTVALHAMAERMGSPDFEWVVQAIAIHREVGGDLADVLDTVAETIRERNMIRRQVKALSAEGRLSAWILMALPFAVGGFVALGNPEYVSVLFDHVAGWVMLAVGAVLLTVGGLWLRKVVRIVF